MKEFELSVGYGETVVVPAGTLFQIPEGARVEAVEYITRGEVKGPYCLRRDTLVSLEDMLDDETLVFGVADVPEVGCWVLLVDPTRLPLSFGRATVAQVEAGCVRRAMANAGR